MALEDSKQIQNTKSPESNATGRIQCNQCQNYSLVLDVLSSEYVCSTCGCVSTEKIYNNEIPYLEKGEYKDKSRLGMPESLTISHKDFLLNLNHDNRWKGKIGSCKKKRSRD